MSGAIWRVATCALLGAFATTTLALADDTDPGRKQFLTSCGTCHTTDKDGVNRQGPNLFSMYGRKAGTLEGFAYSDTLKAGGWVWDETTLDVWITDAQAAHPGTVMNYRQANPDKRKLVIQYLKSLSAQN
jgi:cytochrome c